MTDIIVWHLGMWRVATALRRIRRIRITNRNTNGGNGLGGLVLV